MRPSFTQVRTIFSFVPPSTRDGTFQDAQSLNDFSSLPPELRQIPAHTVFLCPSACSQHPVSHRRTSFTQVRPILSFLSPSTRDGTFQDLQSLNDSSSSRAEANSGTHRVPLPERMLATPGDPRETRFHASEIDSPIKLTVHQGLYFSRVSIP